MKKIIAGSVLLILVSVLFWGCTKKTETLTSPLLNDYYPLQTARAFIYRMDSTIPAPFGTALIVHSYQAKDTIESTFTDNTGRLSYRIFRFVRDVAGTQPWQFAATYVATPAGNRIEYVDNNFRFIKLALPIKDDYSFKAHTYIDTKSLNSLVPYLDEWEYTYQNVGQPYTVSGKTYSETVTVAQHDETTPSGPFNPASYQQRNLGIEVYAKGVGLIYKEFLHWTYQTTPPPAKFEDGSFGVKLSLITYY